MKYASLVSFSKLWFFISHCNIHFFFTKFALICFAKKGEIVAKSKMRNFRNSSEIFAFFFCVNNELFQTIRLVWNEVQLYINKTYGNGKVYQHMARFVFYTFCRFWENNGLCFTFLDLASSFRFGKKCYFLLKTLTIVQIYKMCKQTSPCWYLPISLRRV